MESNKRVLEKDGAPRKDDLIVVTGGGRVVENLALYFKSKGFTNIRAVDKKTPLRVVPTCARHPKPLPRREHQGELPGRTGQQGEVVGDVKGYQLKLRFPASHPIALKRNENRKRSDFVR